MAKKGYGAKKIGTSEYMIVSDNDCTTTEGTIDDAIEEARIHFDNCKELEIATIYQKVGVLKEEFIYHAD